MLSQIKPQAPIEAPKGLPKGLDYILSKTWSLTHPHLVSEPSPTSEEVTELGCGSPIVNISTVITIPQAINRATIVFRNYGLVGRTLGLSRNLRVLPPEETST